MIKKRPNGRSKLRFSNPRQATALFCAELIESHEKFGDQFKRGVEDSQSSELQTTNLDWIGNLSKLTSLRLRFPSATSVMQGLAALQQPSALDLSCHNIQISLELPCSLLSLSLSHFRTVLPNISTLKNLLILRCDDRFLEVGGDSSFIITELNQLKHFSAKKNCDIRTLNGLSMPESLSILSINKCNFMSSEGWAKPAFVDASGLNSPKQFKLADCEGLSEVQGLGASRSLPELIVQRCHSLTKLGTLSDLKQLEVLQLIDCRNLCVEDPRHLKFLKDIKVMGVLSC